MSFGLRVQIGDALTRLPDRPTAWTHQVLPVRRFSRPGCTCANKVGAQEANASGGLGSRSRVSLPPLPLSGRQRVSWGARNHNDIDALGGTVINSVPKYRAIRARLPLAAVQSMAELEAIQWIRPADEAITRGQARAVQAVARAAVDAAVTRKVNTSEGDVAHQADRARRQFGVDGTGIGIGVLSDGVDSLAARQASGDLPTNVTVLPGQARPPASVAEPGETFDEGTPMSRPSRNCPSVNSASGGLHASPRGPRYLLSHQFQPSERPSSALEAPRRVRARGRWTQHRRLHVRFAGGSS